MKAMLAVALATILISSKPAHAFDPAIKDTVYHIEVNVRVSLLYTLVDQESSQTFYGTGFVVSSEGHLLTCVHVAEPENLIESVINNQMPRGYTDDNAEVFLHYRIQNQSGDAYTTDFKPVVKVVKCKHNPVTVSINSMESRPDYDETKRQLRILGQDEKDLLQIKLESGKPLQHISFPPLIPPHPDHDSSKELLYALAARETSDGIFVARRLGVMVQPRPHTLFGTPISQAVMTTVPGDSGSPVINEDSKLIGMIQSHDPPHQAETSYLLQAAYLRKFHEDSVQRQPAYTQASCQPVRTRIRPLARLLK